MNVTNDLTKFGQRELAEAGKLLSVLKTCNDDTKFLGDGVQVFFNTMSGCVFLSDEDCNVAVMEGHQLVDFISCPNCGNEGTLYEFDITDDCCREFHKEMADS